MEEPAARGSTIYGQTSRVVESSGARVKGELDPLDDIGNSSGGFLLVGKGHYNQLFQNRSYPEGLLWVQIFYRLGGTFSGISCVGAIFQITQ